MKKPFTRKQLASGRFDILCKGRWANADLYLFQQGRSRWVIKDFFPCPPLIRKTWGRFIARREYQAFIKLRGIPGMPEASFLMDDYAVCYRFIAGKTLKDTPPEAVGPEFFLKLEALVIRMHARNLVHLDIRNRRNILVTDAGEPALLDFQTSLHLEHMPKSLRNLLMDIDFSGVYKCWNNIQPETLDPERKARLETINNKRSLWMFKGYPKLIKGERRRDDQ
ncbi:MAG: hypothetical protein C4518_15255 [Desulfobacteraceae bacterium]|nr:MAG: hypothetical protein C4518_15255 [Desulfobacteraceae bacterium]